MEANWESINTGMDEDDVCDIKDTVDFFSTRKNEVTLFEKKKKAQ